jgi:DNA mismatch endonuclease (patch repair protein)
VADNLTETQRKECMSNIHSKDTTPEVLLRNGLWHLGFRYRINDKHLPGRPDIVLPKYRTAIFVHGCFWHGHQNCSKYSTPKSNTDYWTAKISRNQQRDQEVWRQLVAKGWFVTIVWECQLKKSVLDETIKHVTTELLENGEELRRIQEERRLSRLAYLHDQKCRKEKTESLIAEIKSHKLSI